MKSRCENCGQEVANRWLQKHRETCTGVQAEKLKKPKRKTLKVEAENPEAEPEMQFDQCPTFHVDHVPVVPGSDECAEIRWGHGKAVCAACTIKPNGDSPAPADLETDPVPTPRRPSSRKKTRPEESPAPVFIVNPHASLADLISLRNWIEQEIMSRLSV